MNQQLELFPASDFCQRWQDRVASWRHRSEGGFDSSRYDVAVVPRMVAAEYVKRHHYAGSYVASRFQWGIFERGDLVGILALSNSSQPKALTNAFPGLEPYQESLELGRLVLADRVPANAESWFVTRCFELAAREGIRGVLSFSDPQPRTRADGTTVMPGHVGIIYQATNALYLGRSKARTLLVLPDGTVLNERSKSKVKPGDGGAGGVEDILVRWGASPRQEEQTGDAWLAEALEQVPLRRLRHRGNHRYGFRVGTRSERRAVQVGLTSLPYPKTVDTAA